MSEENPMTHWPEDVIKLDKEYRVLQDRIVKERVHETPSPENTQIIMRAKELYSLLRKSGYFR